MKTRNVTIILAIAFCFAGPALCADSPAPASPDTSRGGGQAADKPSWMGVLLDATPLPDLLVKHLALSLGQGVRIGNVHRGSPADKAGLERDDIIIGFQGKDVNDYDAFVNNVHKAGVGTEASLTVIHLGQRQTVKLTLEPATDSLDLKYPPEPQMVQSWRPGKVFRLRPGENDWIEMLRDKMPAELDVRLKKFFDDQYTYHHSDGESYTITIEGNPADEDATITVQSGDAQYKTTAKHIDKLPEKYREPAEQALKDARNTSKTRKFEFKTDEPSNQTPSRWRSYLDRFRRPGTPVAPQLKPDDQQMFDKIQEQMRQLQERLDKLEKSQREAPGSKV